MMKKENSKEAQIKEVLEELSKEELIDILLEVTDNHITLKDIILKRYSKDNEMYELDNARRLIGYIVRRYTGSEGYITCRETYGFVNEMQGLLKKLILTDDVLLTLDIASLMLGEAIKAFEYADDSNGDIGYLVYHIINVMEEVSTKDSYVDEEIREKMFYKLLEQSFSELFDEWGDFRVGVLKVCSKSAYNEDLRNQLIIKIESFLNENSEEDQKYLNETILGILFDLIKEYGTEEESEEFIKLNIEYTLFRSLLIDKYMKEKKYIEALELAIEGEEKDKRYPGLISEWKKMRYSIYKKLSMEKEQAKLAKELLIDGDFEYYTELKSLMRKNEMEFYNELKQELKDKSWRYGQNNYLKLIEYEKDLDSLMEFVKENPRYIEEYAKILIDKFGDYALKIYETYINSEALASANRKQYRGVCRIIERYNRIAGEKKTKELINELIRTYERRPAFIDELRESIVNFKKEQCNID